MKKNVWYLLSVCLALGIFASCSDDDKDEVVVLDVNASYEGEKLELKYSDSPLLGKKISFETKDGKTATITMQGTIDLSSLLSLFSKSASLLPSMAPGVIPGEVKTTLSNVPLTLVGEKYTFEGTDSDNGREVKYAGEVTKDRLMMSVNVTMPQNSLTGTWKPAPWIEGETPKDPVVSEPLTIQWVSSKKVTLFPGLPEMSMDSVSVFLSAMASQPLLEALQSITFKTDGNVTASYRNEATKGEWTDSPLNLAWFYIKNDKLYTQLNIDMIMATVEANKSKSEFIDPSSIIALFKEFAPLLSEGVPLDYNVENGKVVVTVDETLLLPILNALFSIPAFTRMISAAIPEEYQAIAGPLLEQLPGILESTTEMAISLNLEK